MITPKKDEVVWVCLSGGQVATKRWFGDVICTFVHMDEWDDPVQPGIPSNLPVLYREQIRQKLLCDMKGKEIELKAKMKKFDIATATDQEIEDHVREKLKDLPEGAYELSDGHKWLVLTGREGKINAEIVFMKLVRDNMGKEEKPIIKTKRR